MATTSRSDACDWLLVGALWGAVAVVLQVLVRTPAPLHLGWPFLAHVSGMLVGYGVAVMVAMMSRAPVLERDLGADRLARWHALGGRLVFVLAVVHGSAAIVGWAEARGLDPLTATSQILAMPGVAGATVGTGLMLGVGWISARSRRSRISYERWHAIHLSLYLAVALTFTHQLAGPDVAGDMPVQVAWGLLYAGAFGLVLRYRFVAPLLLLVRHRLRVQDLREEADGVVSIVLGGRHLDELAAEPGQFFRWRFLSSSTWTSAHPFSLSAAARDDALRITVKALGPGSRRLHRLRPGTWVLAEGPYGAMTARRCTRRRIVLIAGGVGITPMRALLEAFDPASHDVTLLYRASSPEDVVFGQELDAFGAHVVYLVGPSSDPANSLAPEALLQHVPDLASSDVYLCASPRMAAGVRTSLKQLGLPKHLLHHEEFSF